jgi:light-regulated signal transduction histidine kinase (bacteriophytochrome)
MYQVKDSGTTLISQHSANYNEILSIVSNIGHLQAQCAEISLQCDENKITFSSTLARRHPWALCRQMDQPASLALSSLTLSCRDLQAPRAQVKNNGYQDAPSLQVEQQTRPSLLRVYFRRLTQTIPPVHA